MKSLLAAIFPWLRDTKTPLSAIKADAIRREQLQHEQQSQEVAREINRLEQRKQELFLKGKREKSERTRKTIAREIRRLDVRLEAKDALASELNRRLDLTEKILITKELQSPPDTLLNRPDLVPQIEDVAFKLAVDRDKLTRVAQCINDVTDQLLRSDPEEMETRKIMEALSGPAASDLASGAAMAVDAASTNSEALVVPDSQCDDQIALRMRVRA